VRPDGGVDFQLFRRAIESVLHLLPRYRQRLKWIPFENHPVWVDDRQFSLGYHLRHTALPRPGSDEQLKQLSARIMAQPLDRARPLWEIWLVEGLEGNRFAIITKVHHCMMDGESTADLAHILLSPTRETDLSEPMVYIPRPVPSSWDLFTDSLLHRLTLPVRAVRDFQRFSEETADVGAEVWTRVRAIGDLLGWAVRPASKTPLNGRIGPHRRFDWLTKPLAQVKRVAKASGCTVNDVVLATVAGAVREFLLRRRCNPADIDFRVSAPVSVRREEHKGQMGNHVSSWIVRLPIDVADPRQRLETLHAITDDLKRSQQALGVQTMMTVAEWTPNVLLSLGAQAASGPINMVVTNVPGPLLPNTGLGVALFSYDGKLCWGFNGDYELVPDLRWFVRATERSFAELAAAVGVSLAADEAKAPPRTVVQLHPTDPRPS
jgi:diacylglycerol O-acyltransferase